MRRSRDEKPLFSFSKRVTDSARYRFATYVFILVIEIVYDRGGIRVRIDYDFGTSTRVIIDREKTACGESNKYRRKTSFFCA